MPATPSTARAINDRLALRLLQREGPLTAGQLKQLTGLSRPSVADLVERLTAAGLIQVVGEAGEQRRGPNAKLYGIVADRAQLAALDVRTEGVAVLVSDLVGRVLAEASVPIGGETGTGTAVEQAVALVERVAAEAGADRLHTLCIGAPGLIDPASGELRDSSGLPEWHRRLVAALQDRFPRARAHIENETNLAALAEQREGAAHDRDTFVLLWLGHGTGAALVLDGTLRRGASGGAGEIGFLPVPGTSGLPSATDCEGGFHSLAGSAAIAGLAETFGLTHGAHTEEPVAAALVRAAVAAVRGTQGTQGEHAGEPASPAGEAGSAAAGPAGEGAVRRAAARFLDALADRLALGAASVVAVLDPGCVVLGGEVGQAGGDVLADRVARRLRRMAPLPTEVRPGVLGGGAVLRGALLTARETAQEDLFATVAAGSPEAPRDSAPDARGQMVLERALAHGSFRG
ncbi:ROK family transcriptional regulator [Streptomyces sp. ID05-04B]|uniref:ROK family transcriptional regulator n=1 Tax=unclassified Streptomyces TaxID=2593676 RepID=UPI000D1A21B7|nr:MULTISPECIES: ROK family transcriptional regulator [unclassified Streptomyces]AVV43750.1 ROK family transcriptional regulator [Streptomyces sp. P3]MDX5563339.1 ROK family transcriptional regulator [Streptomyces sp. ID05-04B]